MRKSVQIETRLHNLVLKNQADSYEDFREICNKIQHSNAKYAGEYVQTLYDPHFWDSTDIFCFKNLNEILTSICNKTIKRYLENKDFRKNFKFSKSLEKLIDIDPGYKNYFPMARYDIFYTDPSNYKLCEINTDGTSAMNETNTLEKIFLESKIIKFLKNYYRIKYYELFNSWLQELLVIYKEFGGNNKPNIAIIDFEGLGTHEEFITFQKCFKEHGYNTIIADPRELVYENNVLYYKDFAIDLIYRRAVTKEAEKRIKEIKPLIAAYRNKDVCMVGPFRSQIIHSKVFFAVIKNKNLNDYLSPEEKEFVKNYIPETYIFDKEKHLIKAKKEKDSFVLKPFDKYSARGVFIGKNYSDDEWKKIANDCFEKDDYLLQEFCPPPQKEYTVFKDKEPQLEKYNSTLGLFIYNEKFKGLYSRIGKNLVIGGSVGYKVLPNFFIK